jgi:L-serine dehydratase
MGHILLGGAPESIELHFYGNALARTYKGHLSDSAIVAGLLGYGEDAPIVRTALDEAARRGIPVTYHTEYESDRNPNTVDMRLSRNGKTLRVVGITVGGGEILMTEFGKFPIRLRGSEEGILFTADRSFDANGLESLLGEKPLGVVRAEEGNDALWTCLLDRVPSPEIAGRLRASRGVSDVFPLSAVLDYKLRDTNALFTSFDGMLRLAEDRKCSLPQIATEYECRRSGLAESDVRARIARIWGTMKESVENGIRGKNDLVAGLVPGDCGARMLRAVEEGRTVGGRTLGKAVARAIAAMETNACARCVVAAPTAGSCGVVPGALITAVEERNASDDEAVDALLAAAVTGTLIAMRASLSGSIGGCQAEIGVASAMAGAALVQLAGGTPGQVAHGMALAMKNILGLICDPVAGPVEIPCIKRNGIGVANAFAAADMALSGLESAIPPDEVVGALANTQQLLPPELRGTMKGGLGSTPTAMRLKEEWNRKVTDMALHRNKNA